MRLAIEMTTETLAPAEAEEFETLVDSAHFFDLPPVFKPPMEGADQFQYRLTVEKGDQLHSVETSDSATPENLQPLIDRLTEAARSQRNR